MATVPPHSIVSGVDYVVLGVNGQAPAHHDDFSGDVRLDLVYEATSGVRHEQAVQGVGLVCDDGVFLNEKDDHGKDLRRWQLTSQPDGRWTARQGLF